MVDLNPKIIEDLFDLLKGLVSGLFSALIIAVLLGQKFMNIPYVYFGVMFLLAFSVGGIGIVLFRYFTSRPTNKLLSKKTLNFYT